MPARGSNAPWGEPALKKYTRGDTPKSLMDYNHVCPLPKAVLPSRLSKWAEENVQGGWFIQYPIMGHATFKTAVIVFQDFEDCELFRNQYCFDTKYHKPTHRADYDETLGDNI